MCFCLLAFIVIALFVPSCVVGGWVWVGWLYGSVQVAERRRLARVPGYQEEARTTQLPDDVALLLRLAGEGLLIGTPPQDYDDSYSIRFVLRPNVKRNRFSHVDMAF